MSDREAIVDVITHLFVGTDDRDWERVKRCFCDQVVFDMTSLGGGTPETKTPQQIVDGWDVGLRGIDAIHHQAGNYLVEVSGAEATAFCYGVAYHHRKGQPTRMFVGSYDFHFTRTEGWRIDRFAFRVKFVEPPL
ncbi:MAG: nuclear transport factor 2 family protein [Kofleriaceae bacterium]